MEDTLEEDETLFQRFLSVPPTQLHGYEVLLHWIIQRYAFMKVMFHLATTKPKSYRNFKALHFAYEWERNLQAKAHMFLLLIQNDLRTFERGGEIFTRDEQRNVALVYQTLTKQVSDRSFVRELLSAEEAEVQGISNKGLISEEGAVELFKIKGELIDGVCLNAANPAMLAVASPAAGIREVNIIHSIRFRPRGNMRHTLLDDEGEDFKSSLHRFDSMANDLRDPTSTSAILSRHKLIDKRRERNTDVDHLEGIKFKMSFGINPRAQRTIKVLTLTSHPKEPYFISGGDDGRITLWRYGEEDSVAEYVHASIGILQSSEMKNEAAMRETERGEGGQGRARTSSVYSGVTKHKLPECRAKITSIVFNAKGTRFAVGDADGYVSFYRFQAGDISLYPFLVIKAHKKTNCLAFINHGSYLASGGVSQERDRSLCLWDTIDLDLNGSGLRRGGGGGSVGAGGGTGGGAQLRSLSSTSPNPFLLSSSSSSSALSGSSVPSSTSSGPMPRRSYGDDELAEGVSSLAFVPKHSLLFAGCRRGQVVAFSTLHHTRVRSIFVQPLLSDVRTLAVDEEGEYLAAGGKEGDLKVWHVDTLVAITSNSTRPAKEHASIPVAHEKKTFFKQGGHSAISTYGVTKVVLTRVEETLTGKGVCMLSCGADGRVCAYGFHPENVAKL
uniref:Uncharacterized protein n=1 Tax=Palpitomonas bilix TaxID=652834 RepID=A0A7S3DHI1_9EUKA